MSRPGVNLMTTKWQNLKPQMQAFKCLKFVPLLLKLGIKMSKVVLILPKLGLKMPKNGVQNSKKEPFKMPKIAFYTYEIALRQTKIIISLI